MKKIALSVAAFVAAAPFVLASGAAFAANTYTSSLVKQFDTTGDSGYAPDSIIPFNDTQAVVYLDNKDLWLTDGTTAGTVDVTQDATDAGLTDWNLRWDQWNRRAIADGQGNLYFVGQEGADWNIWKYDGTDFTQVSTGDFSYIREIYLLDGNIYAWGRTRSSTAPGAQAFYQIALPSGDTTEILGGNNCEGPQQESRQVSFVDPYIVFANDTDSNCNWQLMSWDPSNPGNTPVDLGAATGASGAGSDFAAADDRYVWNGELYFGGRTDPDDDFELWTTDGTVGGTVHLKSLADGNTSSYPGSDGMMWFTEYNGELYFTAYDGSDNLVFKTDGTDSGTVVAIDSTFVQPNDYAEGPGVLFDGKMALTFSDPDHGEELFLTDGTTAGTSLLKDINSNAADNSMCNNYCVVPVAFDNHLFFAAFNGTRTSVWVSDGTEAGTIEATDFGSATAVADFNEFALVPVGNHLLFGVSDYTENGGTGEMALYSFDSQESALAKTGADVDALAFAGLFALVAGAGVYAVRRRARA